jgi:hypothetical protein
MVLPTLLASKPVLGIKSVHNAFKVENKLWYGVNLPHCHPNDLEVACYCESLAIRQHSITTKNSTVSTLGTHRPKYCADKINCLAVWQFFLVVAVLQCS